jgi:hypothetical protein
MDAGVGGTFNWQIDGGLHGSGTIDQTLDYDFTRRFVEILVNDLPAAHHTLTITATGDANAGLFPGHSAYAQIDAIATIFTEVEPVTAARHWSLLQ